MLWISISRHRRQTLGKSNTVSNLLVFHKLCNAQKLIFYPNSSPWLDKPSFDVRQACRKAAMAKENHHRTASKCTFALGLTLIKVYCCCRDFRAVQFVDTFLLIGGTTESSGVRIIRTGNWERKLQRISFSTRGRSGTLAPRPTTCTSRTFPWDRGGRKQEWLDAKCSEKKLKRSNFNYVKMPLEILKNGVEWILRCCCC